MRKIVFFIVLLVIISNIQVYGEETNGESVNQDVQTDGSAVCAVWFEVFDNLLADKALNGFKFYDVLDSVRKPSVKNTLDQVLNSNSTRMALLSDYDLNTDSIYHFLDYYIDTYPEDMAKVICCGANAGNNIYADIYFDKDYNYSKYMVRFHAYLNELFDELPSRFQAVIRKYDRADAGEIIVMQRLMNYVIEDYIAFEKYDTGSGDIISRELRLRNEIRGSLINELTKIANTYSEEFANDPLNDTSVDLEEIEHFIDAFMAFGNVMLETVEIEVKEDELIDELFELADDTKLLIRSEVVSTTTVEVIVHPITLSLNADFIELDSSSPLTSGYINKFQLIPTVRGTDKPVIYSTDKPDLVNVDSNGLITLSTRTSGLAKVYATIQGYDVYQEVSVEVSEATPAGFISFFGPYISGYPDKSFRADSYITRAEIATMFTRVLRLDINPVSNAFVTKEILFGPTYTDIPEDHWSYVYVELAKIYKILYGYDDETFRPNDPITRAEIAVIISNAWELLGIESSNSPNHEIYDVDSSHWAYDAINRVYNAGIVSGYDDGTFKPDQYTTRAEIVVIINNMLNREDTRPEEESFNDIPKDHWAYGYIESAIRIQQVKRDVLENN